MQGRTQCGRPGFLQNVCWLELGPSPKLFPNAFWKKLGNDFTFWDVWLLNFFSFIESGSRIRSPIFCMFPAKFELYRLLPEYEIFNLIFLAKFLIYCGLVLFSQVQKCCATCLAWLISDTYFTFYGIIISSIFLSL